MIVMEYSNNKENQSIEYSNMSFKDFYRLDDCDIPIFMLGLSNRSINALKRVGIENYKELISLSIFELKNIRNLGTSSINEILDVIADKDRITNLYNSFISMKDKRGVNGSYIEASENIDTIETNIKNIVDLQITNERTLSIIKERNDGKTLENLANKYNLTRERIRQIESSLLKKITIKLNIINIADFLYDLSESGYLDIDTIKNNIELHNCFVLIYVLKTSKIKNVKYDKVLDCFFICVPDNFLEAHYQVLPDFIENNNVDNVIGSITENKCFSKKLLYAIVYKMYYHNEKYYSKNKMNTFDKSSILISKYYPDGIKITDNNELKKLAYLMDENFGTTYSNKLRALQSRVRDTCVMVDKGTYAPDIENKYVLDNELLKKIEKYVQNNNHNIISLNYIYEIFKNDIKNRFCSNLYIFESILKEAFKEKYIFSKDYLYKSEQKFNYEVEVISFILEKKGIVTNSQINEEFNDIKSYVLRKCLSSQMLINMTTGYIHKENLKITNNEVVRINQILKDILADNHTHHIDDVYSKVFNFESGVLSKNGIDKPDKLYYFLKSYFEKEFNFSKPYLANKNINIERGEDKLLKELLTNGETSIDDLRTLGSKYNVYIGSILGFVNDNIDNIVFKNDKRIISLKSLKFNSNIFDNIDDVVDCFIGESEVESLYRFQNFSDLPVLSIEWNYWLLYSIIKLYSDKFDVTTTSNHFNKAVPLVFTKGYEVSEQDKQKFEGDVPYNFDDIFLD